MVGRVDGVLILVGVVLGDEDADLRLKVEAPVAVARQGHGVAHADASADAFAHPSAVGVEADAVDAAVDVGLQEEA